VAMRSGDLPFRQVFSSQGPLFLPLVWLADLVGLRALAAPRLLAVAAGAGMVAATWAAARSLSLPVGRALLAAGLVGTSGSVLWVTGPLTSDGPALALATAAVALALAYRRSPSAGLALAAGLCLGAALSVKSLLVGAAVPVGLALLPNRRHLGTAAAAVALVGLVTALPWGLGVVWDQAFRYHLEAAGSRTPVANLSKAVTTLADRDLPLLAAALGVGLAALTCRPGRTRGPALPALARRRPEAAASGIALIGAWLAATVAVLALEHPLWRNHVAHLVPPVALLVAAGAGRLATSLRQSPATALAVGIVVAGLVSYHAVHNAGILLPPAPAEAEAAAGRDLAGLPPGAWAISDEPGLVWRSGRRTPSDLVDTSVLRLDSGRITTASLARAASEPQVCALLVWSQRFGRLTDLPARLDGYRVAARYGGPRVLYVKETCRSR
jgi:hypothetical protein